MKLLQQALIINQLDDLFRIDNNKMIWLTDDRVTIEYLNDLNEFMLTIYDSQFAYEKISDCLKDLLMLLNGSCSDFDEELQSPLCFSWFF